LPDIGFMSYLPINWPDPPVGLWQEAVRVVVPSARVAPPMREPSPSPSSHACGVRLRAIGSRTGRAPVT
jgi:hypothetical protein